MQKCSPAEKPVPDQIITLNVGGQRFATSSQTLSWIPDTFFSSLMSGRIPTVRDDSGAIFIDRDPDVFRVILNYLRTKQIDLSSVSVESLKHEAQFFNIVPLIRRLTLCEELETSSCGSVLFHGLIPPPGLPASAHCKKTVMETASSRPANSGLSSNVVNRKNGPSNEKEPGSSVVNSAFAGSGKDTKIKATSHKGSEQMSDVDASRVRIIRAHYNTIVVAYAFHACVYRMKESIGWQRTYNTAQMDAVVKHVALNTKFGSQNSDKMLALALGNDTLHLWRLGDDGTATKRGTFSLGVAIDKLFFIGSQMVALSKTGKVGIWQSVNQNWQVQELVPISCYDMAASSLLLGCTNGSMYYIDMQKFPLRMKDNDLLVTELYRDPNGDCITAISVYLTPKTTVCGNWIEIAYGTSAGAVRVIVQHPETVGHGPQLFQTYTVHNSPVIRVALNTNHLISVCSEYNHVRTWAVTRFRGMISTQPGNTSLASFKVLSLDSTEDNGEQEYTDVGPFGDQDGEHVFVQRVIPETNKVFIRLASTGDRICTIKTVDGASISAFTVHECEGSSRMGNRPRRFLFVGTNVGNVQMFDLSTALDQYHSQRMPATICLSGPNQGDREQPLKPPQATMKQTPSFSQTLAGPSPQELLQLIDDCDICCSASNTPVITPHTSYYNLANTDSSDS